jgi:glycosyltransferase involved in cell wall biosynthesis
MRFLPGGLPMSPQVAPVSCYIRTLNEERKIGEVVAAARAVVDEVVVVDSGSTDATVAIAQAAGARVIHQEWLGNGRQKRFAEEQCRNDYLLDLDADEVVSPALAEEIRALFGAGSAPLPIYRLELVMVPPTGKPWHGFWRARRCKLYDRRVVRVPDHKAWDQFEVPDDARVGHLSAPLFHHSYRDLAHLVTKLNRASTVRAMETRRRGRLAVGARVLFAFPVYFAKHYLQRGLFRGGVYGVALASILAYGRWLRDAKMYEAMLLRRPQSTQDERARAERVAPVAPIQAGQDSAPVRP